MNFSFTSRVSFGLSPLLSLSVLLSDSQPRLDCPQRWPRTRSRERLFNSLLRNSPNNLITTIQHNWLWNTTHWAAETMANVNYTLSAWVLHSLKHTEFPFIISNQFWQIHNRDMEIMKYASKGYSFHRYTELWSKCWQEFLGIEVHHEPWFHCT